MSKHQAGKHFKQSGSRAATPQKPKRKVSFIRLMLGMLIIFGVSAITRGCIEAGSQARHAAEYHTLEDVYNEYLNSSESEKDEVIDSLIKKVMHEVGSDEYPFTIQGNEIISTYTIPSEASLVDQFRYQRTSLDEDVINAAADSIKTIEVSLTDAGITLNGDLMFCLICANGSGQEISRTTYSRDGLISHEAVDLPITIEDMFNDDSVLEAKKDADEQLRELEDSFEEFHPGSHAWYEIHGNEMEIILRLNAQSDEIILSAIDDYYREEQTISEIVTSLQQFVDLLRNNGLGHINVSTRRTFQDAEGNVLATYLYNLDGLVEE